MVQLTQETRTSEEILTAFEQQRLQLLEVHKIVFDNKTSTQH
jgi:hypothetical protein